MNELPLYHYSSNLRWLLISCILWIKCVALLVLLPLLGDLFSLFKSSFCCLQALMVKLESAENKASSLDIEVRFYFSPVIYGHLHRTDTKNWPLPFVDHFLYRELALISSLTYKPPPLISFPTYKPPPPLISLPRL